MKQIGIALLVLVAIAFVFKNRLVWMSNKNTIESQRLVQKNLDEEVLESADKTDPNVLYAALIRLSMNPTSGVKGKVLSLANSKSAKIRGGVAFFLVNQKDDSLAGALKELMRDPDPEVKSNIARGLNYNPNQDRVPVIQQYLAAGNLSDMDRSLAFSAMYRSVPTQGEKDSVLKTLLEFANQTKNQSLAEHVILDLCNLAPENEKVIALLRASVQKNLKSVVPVAIRTLAVKRDSWMMENIEKLVNSPDMEIKRSSIASLHFLCPISRWDLIEKGVKEGKTVETYRPWIEEIQMMPGDQALELISRLNKLEKVKGTELQALLASALSSVKSSKFTDPCRMTK